MKKIIFQTALVLFLTIFCLGQVNVVSAANPLRTIGYQGQLLNSQGAPQNGEYPFTFKFFGSEVGGSQIGSTISKNVQVTNGYVSVNFSEGDLTGINFNQVLFLEIAVKGNTLNPRAPINSVAFSNATFGFISGAGAPTLANPADGAAYFDTTANTLYVYDGASWSPLTAGSSSGSGFVNDGNSFGGVATLGTNDNYALRFETNGVARGGFSSEGLFSIGTTTASTTLFIQTVSGTHPLLINNAAGSGIFTLFDSGSLFVGSGAGVGMANNIHSTLIGLNAGNAAEDSYNAIFVGRNAGNGASSSQNSIFLGEDAGRNAYQSFNSIFMGYQSGYGNHSAYSNFLGANTGYGAGEADYSNFMGYAAGFNATNAQQSNFLGRNAGYNATDALYANFLGTFAGNEATNASNSIFIGQAAGSEAINAANSIFLGVNTGNGDSVDNTGNIASSSILIGNYSSTGGFSDSISIGQGTQNTAAAQANIGNVLYATNIRTAASASATVKSGGRVGVGTEAPSTMFQVGKTGNEGNITVFGTATTCTIGNGSGATMCSSDQRLKHNINDAAGMLDKVMQLRPVTFSWNENLNRGSATKLGLIAQDVDNVFPEFVSEVYDGYKGVDYAALVTPLIGSVQELNNKISDINTRIAAISNSSSIKSDSSVTDLLGDVYESSEPITLDADEAKATAVSDVNADDFIASVLNESNPDVIDIFALNIKKGKRFLSNFVTARVTAVKGYFGEIFANKATINELCLKDESGTTCYNRAELNKVLGVKEEQPAIELPKQEETVTTVEVVTEEKNAEEIVETKTDETAKDELKVTAEAAIAEKEPVKEETKKEKAPVTEVAVEQPVVETPAPVSEPAAE